MLQYLSVGLLEHVFCGLVRVRIHEINVCVYVFTGEVAVCVFISERMCGCVCLCMFS